VNFISKFKKPSTYPLHPITLNNTRSLRITATAGTKLVGTLPQIYQFFKSSYRFYKYYLRFTHI